MLIYILLGLSIGMGFLNGLLGKRFQLGFTMDVPHFISYNLINALLATVYFFVGSGFRIHMNLITFLYAVGYGVIVITSLVSGLFALSKLTVSFSGIVGTAGTTILSAVFGIFVFKEPTSWRFLASMVFMLLALIIPCGKLWGSGKRGSLLICVVSFFNSGAAVLLQKFYTVTPGVCDNNSFFLMTNVCIAIFCAILLLVLYLKKPEIRAALRKPFTLKQLANIATRTLLSNLTSIVTIILLTKMDVSVYTIVHSSLGIASGALLSAVVFKERMHRQNWIAVALAICAVVVNA